MHTLGFAVLIFIQSLYVTLYKKYKINKYLINFVSSVGVILLSKILANYQKKSIEKQPEKFQNKDTNILNSNYNFFIFILISSWNWIRDIIKLFAYGNLYIPFVKGTLGITTISALVSGSYLRGISVNNQQLLGFTMIIFGIFFWSFIRGYQNLTNSLLENKVILMVLLILITRIIDGIVITYKKEFVNRMEVTDFTLYQGYIYSILGFISCLFFVTIQDISFFSIMVYGICVPITFIMVSYLRKILSQVEYVSISSIGILFTVLLSYIFFNINLLPKEIWGILSIIVGIIIVNKYLEKEDESLEQNSSILDLKSVIKI